MSGPDPDLGAPVATYTIDITPANIDGGYVGSVRELPGVRSQGETVNETMRATMDALDAVLDAE